MTKRALLIIGLTLAGCAAATGYDASRYTDEAKAKPDADVDTEALPPVPKKTMPDPRRPFVMRSDASTP